MYPFKRHILEPVLYVGVSSTTDDLANIKSKPDHVIFSLRSLYQKMLSLSRERDRDNDLKLKEIVHAVQYIRYDEVD